MHKIDSLITSLKYYQLSVSTQFSSTALSTVFVDNFNVIIQGLRQAWLSYILLHTLILILIGKYPMKADLHPNYNEIKVACSCGHEFTTRSTLKEDLTIEVCSQCHPFYTGQQKILDTAGRVDKFRRKYGMD